MISTSPTSRPISADRSLRQPLAQRGDALGLRVAVVAGADRFDRGVLGDVGHVEIGQADREVDRVLHLGREVEDLADARGVDAQAREEM